jgi:acetyl esterase/lipase
VKSEIRVIFLILSIIIGAVLLTLSGCSLKSISRSKDIVYTQAGKTVRTEQRLSIFAPKKQKQAADVLVFIHGGNWNSGKKSQYNIMGSHWAKKGIVYVIIDYPLSPAADYKEMAAASAASVKWVKENIGRYGGNPGRIFVSGHSAGGHLAALISVDDQYFKQLGIEIRSQEPFLLTLPDWTCMVI